LKEAVVKSRFAESRDKLKRKVEEKNNFPDEGGGSGYKISAKSFSFHLESRDSHIMHCKRRRVIKKRKSSRNNRRNNRRKRNKKVMKKKKIRVAGRKTKKPIFSLGNIESRNGYDISDIFS